MPKRAGPRLTRTLAVAGILAWLFAADARGQTAPVAPPSDATAVSEVVVTGSHIPQTNLVSVSPVAIVGADEIKAEGATRVEDVINRLPQAAADQNSAVNNSATGTATVNLRDLGSERTLVLIDGKRVAPGDPTSGEIAPDLNFIPDALVDRIEIVSGGASAVYGSDAIAGVVNFIMKKDFAGVRIDAQTGFFNHSNGDSQVRAALVQAGDAPPPSSVNDGLTSEVTLIAGVNAPNDRGNLTAYAGYRRTDAVPQSSRDFSACALQANGAAEACSGSMYSTALGRFVVLDPNTFDEVGDLTLDPTGPGNTLRAFDVFRDAYNFAPFQYFQRPDERYTTGAFAHYQISPAIDLYADGMFMDDRSVAQLAPSGLFVQPFTISCDNPMLSAAEVQSFCADANVPAGGDALVFIGRRNVEGGPRLYSLTHRDYRVVVGAKGGWDAWRYDVSVQYSAVSVDQIDLHDISLSRAADALDVVRNAAGALVCASGNPGCAPYDIFQIGGVTPAALAYLEAPGIATASTGETVASATLSGDLARYGVKTPWAPGGLGLALGAEFRSESLGYSPNAELATGDLASAGVSSPPVSGAFEVYEVYGEARLPLVQGRPWMRDLTLEGGYRFSWYSSAGAASTYKAGAEWAPSPDLRLRASFNRAVRAPNVVELFTPQTLTPSGFQTDPCAGADPIVDNDNPFATPANCARTGVGAGQYGTIAAAPNGYNILLGGNADLKPETADTLTLGLALTPRALGAFSLTADYFDIKVSGAINNIDPQFAIEQCLETGNNFLCGLIHRAPGTGSLWLGSQGYVITAFENTAVLRTRGVDFEAKDVWPLPSWRGRDLGHLSADFEGGFVASFTTQATPGGASYDCSGLFGPTCGDPLPKWRHTLRLTWNAPWRFDVTAAWRYIAPVMVDSASSNPVLAMPFAQPDSRLASRSYFDLGATWRMNRRLELRAGVNNIFDVDPPVIGSDVQNGVITNGNTFPGLYDALGRYLFVGLTASL